MSAAIMDATIGWMMILLGVSYLVHQDYWLTLHRHLRQKPRKSFPLMFALAFLSALVIHSHNLSSQGSFLAYLLAWITLAKAIAFLFFGQYMIELMDSTKDRIEGWLPPAGVGCIIAGLIIMW